ncbi:MAG: membrane dipeptidase [Pseudomonadota bacterium]
MTSAQECPDLSRRSATRQRGLSRRSVLAGLGVLGAAGVGVGLLRGGGSGPAFEPIGGKIVVNGLDTSTIDMGYINKMVQGGAHCVHKTISHEERFALQSYEDIQAFADDNRDAVAVAKSVADIRRAYAEGKVSIVMGSQRGRPYLNETLVNDGPFASYEVLVDKLDDYHARGLRIQSIAYNVTNALGGGCLDNDVPLTVPGRRFVEELHKRRIVLDVGGHVGERTTLEAIEASSGIPVIATHTNIEALNPNIRADSDRVLEAIAGTGGCIGITAISDFHMRNPSNADEHGPKSPRATLDIHLDQYDYLKRLVGIDHVALGPDFISGWVEYFPMPHNDNLTFPEHSMSSGTARLVENFEDISMLPNVIAGLRERGWTSAELDKLLGDNLLRVYEQVWGA